MTDATPSRTPFVPASINVVPAVERTDEPIPSPQPQATTSTLTVELPHGNGQPPFTAVLWDLDGTISDSAAAIVSAMRDTFDALRMPIPDATTLRSYVGPPINDSFREQGLDDGMELVEALETYRAFQREQGHAATPAYAGVPDIVRAVHAAGIPQSLATSKNEDLAESVLAYYGFADQFDAITGASPDETRSMKSEVVAEALRRLDAKGADLTNVVMIGDRNYDVLGALANGVPAIYVTWGYGRIGEEDGSVGVASNPAELRGLLGLV